ncbi:SEC7 domain-containing protein [Cryptosporidium andersoni]|uniref:SEC7 domain-containing protein n=1 Tax=Cryptosporidium andersoni TaxID=117008 RepID=A0A1J4MTZ6_9CRYT|nr:SEC7 domain-containing protein [Cryptosporidium andersoni]
MEESESIPNFTRCDGEKLIQCDRNSNLAKLRCIKDEIHKILVLLRLPKHHTIRSRFNVELVEAAENPLIHKFRLLSESLLYTDVIYLDGDKLEPFLDAVQSADIGSTATACAIDALNKFLLQGLVDTSNINSHNIANSIVTGLLNCRFTASGSDSDESTLLKLINTLVDIIKSPLANLIDSDLEYQAVIKCFQISRHPRASHLLKSTGENSMFQLVIIIFKRFGEKINSDKINNFEGICRLLKFLSVLSSYNNTFRTKTSNIDEFDLKMTTIEDEITKLLQRMISIDSTDSLNIIEIRVMGLSLLNAALESGGSALGSLKLLNNLIQYDVCGHIMINMLNSSEQIFDLTLRCIFNIFFYFKAHTKKQFELYFSSIMWYIVRDDINNSILSITPTAENFTILEQRELALEFILEICGETNLAIELYQNYDCDLLCGNLFQSLIRCLVSQFNLETPDSVTRNTDIKNTFTIFQRISLKGLTLIIRGLLRTLLENLYQWEFVSISEQDNIQPNGRYSATLSLISHISTNSIGSLSALREQKELKIRLEKGSQFFNNNSSRCIEDLQGLDLLPVTGMTAKDMALFCRSTPGIDPQILGEYISKNKDWNGQVRAAYMSTFSFCGETLVDSLRAVLLTFRLPGEAQQIERIMESFAVEFFIQQEKCDITTESSDKGKFDSNTVRSELETPRIMRLLKSETTFENSDWFTVENSDTIFILSYSIIMLNTDLHNSQVKNKMSIEEFIKNNRGINNKKDLPPEFLISIFNSIKSNKIELSEYSRNSLPFSGTLDFCINYDSWRKQLRKPLGLQNYAMALNNQKKEKDESNNFSFYIYKDIFHLIVDEYALDCILKSFNLTTDISIMANCMEAVLDLVALACIFENTTFLYKIIQQLSLYINVAITARCQFILPIFFHIIRFTASFWSEVFPWDVLIEVILKLHSLRLLPSKWAEWDEFIYHSSKCMSTHLQYPIVHLSSRSKTFGITYGYESINRLTKNLHSSDNLANNTDNRSSSISNRKKALRIVRGSLVPFLKTMKSKVSSSSNNWLIDLTSLIFRSTEEEEEETTFNFLLEPQSIADGALLYVGEQDERLPKQMHDNLSFTPSEMILSWILNGSSPFLAISIYIILRDTIRWNIQTKFLFSRLFQDRVIFEDMDIDLLPSISGNAWELFEYFCTSCLPIDRILYKNLRNTSPAYYLPFVDCLINKVNSFPFPEGNSNTENILTYEDLPGSINSNSSEFHESKNSEYLGLSRYIPSDWGPLVCTHKMKLNSFRKVADSLLCIDLLMVIVSLTLPLKSYRNSNSLKQGDLNSIDDAKLWKLVADLFTSHIKRYSIFNSQKGNINSEELDDSTKASREILENIDNSKSESNNNRSLTRSELMFIERVIVNSLQLLMQFVWASKEITIPLFTGLLEAFVQLHPIVFSLHAERIVAALQFIMQPSKENSEVTSFERNEEYISFIFHNNYPVLLILGILQRMVYIPSLAVSSSSVSVPEFYPGRLSDPQALVLTSLECLGIWLYNSNYTAFLHSKISLIIQTLVTFAIYTPTIHDGCAVILNPDDDSAENNYDANLQAVSLICSLLSLYSASDHSSMLPPVVHTLCLVASYGPNVVRRHAITRLQQTLGSLPVESAWFVESPWVWWNIIQTCFLPLITYEFSFPYHNIYKSGNKCNDISSALLAQRFTLAGAQIVLGNEAVLRRQAEAVTTVSRIILTRIDLLLKPLLIPEEIMVSDYLLLYINNERVDSVKSFILLIPVLISLIDTLISQAVGSLTVFFAETLKNIILVVASSAASTTFDELVIFPLCYFEVCKSKSVIIECLRFILNECKEKDILGVMNMTIRYLVHPKFPDFAVELNEVLDLLKSCEGKSSEVNNELQVEI